MCGRLVSSLFTPAGQDGEAGGGGWEPVPQPFQVEVGTSNQEAAELPHQLPLRGCVAVRESGPSLLSCPERCLPDRQHLPSGF